jgi:peptidoglycan/xylan/chitin deacetylase (PgdA/CDA1 family)
VHALVLEYHDVFDGTDPDSSGFPGSGPASYKLPTSVFRQHLDALDSGGLTASLAPNWLANGNGGRPLFLTFDDGGTGAASAAADALETHGWRGHFFLTAGRIGTRGFLDSIAARDLHRRGHLIGTHSYSHPTMMGALRHDEILEEWRRSRDVIEDQLGERIVAGSVPGGYYTRTVGEAAAEAGLEILFTSMPRTKISAVGECRIFGRYTIRRWTTALSAARIASGAAAPRLSQWTLYTTLNSLRGMAGPHYTKLRNWYWTSRRKRGPDV